MRVGGCAVGFIVRCILIPSTLIPPVLKYENSHIPAKPRLSPVSQLPKQKPRVRRHLTQLSKPLITRNKKARQAFETPAYPLPKPMGLPKTKAWRALECVMLTYEYTISKQLDLPKQSQSSKTNAPFSKPLQLPKQSQAF